MQFSKLENVIREFPPDVQMPARHLTEWIVENRGISKEDFSELRLALQNLTVAQAHTEEKVQKLAEGQERLSEAQERTEQKIQKLSESHQRLEEAQQRTEQKVQELSEAQQRTDESLKRLSESHQRLAEAQERTEQSLQRLAKAQERTERKVDSLSDQIAALGSRWGIYNEVTFRSTIRGLLENMEGITVEEGFYGDRQVDVIIRNGEHILLEITSRMNSKDIEKLYRSADDYQDRTGVEPKLMMAATHIPLSVMRKIVTLERPIEIFSYDSDE